MLVGTDAVNRLQATAMDRNDIVSRERFQDASNGLGIGQAGAWRDGQAASDGERQVFFKLPEDFVQRQGAAPVGQQHECR